MLDSPFFGSSPEFVGKWRAYWRFEVRFSEEWEDKKNGMERRRGPAIS